MKTINLDLYTFDELSEQAQAKACNDYRANGFEFFWIDESIESIKAFCELFNVKLLDYSVGAHEHFSFKTDAANKNFRGYKLKHFDANDFRTGYCIDDVLNYHFHNEFVQTSDALYAFKEALRNAFEAIRSDMESQLEDENIGEHLQINDYQFTIDGDIYNV